MAAETKYDQFSYPSAPFDYSHCRRLETVARLFGMQPAPLPGARVLELGCGDGSNLIPQAENYPEATFVGIDYAELPIDQGRALIQQVGLTNVELRAQNVMDLDPASGPYDYVIAHGLYSWIPPAVQRRTLELLPQLLAPQGVAFISYNTLPGWHLRRTVRDLMLIHTAQIHEPSEKVAQARAILQWVTTAARENDPYRTYLEKEMDLLDRKPDGYLYHDHLEDQNEALYFREFISRARDVGMQFLGEAEIAYMFWHDIPAKQQQDLARLPVEVAEQLMDFIRNRSFRKTLLCHQDVELNRHPSLEVLRSMYYGMEKPASLEGLDLARAEPLRLQVGGNFLEIAQPLAQAALVELCMAYPQSLNPADVARQAVERLQLAGVPFSGDTPAAVDEVSRFLWNLASAGILEVYAHPPQMLTTVSPRPRVSPLVRHHAHHAQYTTNRKHMWVKLDDVSRRTLTLLDGTRPREEVVTAVAGSIARGEIQVGDGAPSAEELARNALNQLAQCCLLIE